MARPSQAQTFSGTDEGGGGETSDATTLRPEPPRTPYEEAVIAIWRDVLDRRDIGVFDDFFSFDAQSLHAIQVVARLRKTLGVDISVRDFLESPTVAALASAVAARSSSARRTVSPRPPDAEPVLSFHQQRLWLDNQLQPGPAYNIQARRRVVGPLNAAVLEASIRAIVARHEALRTRFPTVDGGPAQIVDDVDENWRLSVEDLTEVADPAAVAGRLADEQAVTPFDLAAGPLFRCLLIKLSDTEHMLSVTMHHIISDAWSTGLFARELSALYLAGGDVDRAGLPALPVQYRDFAVWQREWLAGEELDAQVSYWRTHLADAPPALALPAARRLVPDQGSSPGRLRSMLSEKDTAALHDLCRKHGVTEFMVLLASLATVLSRWSGQSDVVIGVPIANRTYAGTEKLIGFFVNTLPLRVDLSGNPSFVELLERVRQVALGGYAHSDAPFDVLVKELRVSRDPRRTPLFQAALNVVDVPTVERFNGVALETVDIPVRPAPFDLALNTQESDDTIQLELHYNAGRYQAAMMRVLVEQLQTLLHGVTDDPTRGILEYPLQAAGEITSRRTQPDDRPAPHLAVERHAADPGRIAVIDRDGEWSYRWLHQTAERVAQVLAERNVEDGHQLGVVPRPTAAFVAAVLGCVKAGATVCVIEAAERAPYPGISAVLDVSPTGEAPAGTIDLSSVFGDEADPSQTDHDVPDPSPTPCSDPAVDQFELRGDDRFTVLANLPGHLLSAMSGAFAVGAALAIPDPAATSDIDQLTAWLRTNSISVIYLNPPVLRAMAAHDPRPQLPALRYAFVDNSGEFISHDVEALRHLSPACRCVGVYRVDRDGHPFATYAVPDDWQPQTAPLRVPIGVERADPAVLVNPAGHPAAIGEVGEICLGADRTGDLGRRWPDGTLEFVGKPGRDPVADPIETLAALRDVPGVRDAVVTEQVATDGQTTINGYVVGPDPQTDPSEIRQHLAAQLPDYLVPEHLFILDKMPLTPNGEYDLSALASAREASGPADSYVAPRTPVEHRIAEILQETLNISRVGVHDSFFELGGFSLMATRLTTHIRETFEVELSLRDVIESPTIDGLAQLIVRAQAELSNAEELEALLNEIGGTEPEHG